MMSDIISLAPPMGWNSWYCFSEGVSDVRIRDAAQGMSERGLAACGWRYINIDDCWQGTRGGVYGALQGNERFPDMRALGDYIHSLGLKFGIYSTPWICSCAGFLGGSCDDGQEVALRLPESERRQKHQFYGSWPGGQERGVFRVGSQWRVDCDVKQWAEWGVDLVKMDWCPNDIPTTRRIAADFQLSPRPILLSISSAVDLAQVDEFAQFAQMWRIARDITDHWECIRHIGFELAPRVMAYTRPGRWNDLDILQIGDIGTAGTLNETYRKSNLTFEEQKTQLVLWSMYSAPLLLSCDLAGMDEVTFALLSNRGVIAIDQDRLCLPPRITVAGRDLLCYEKILAGKKKAVAYFNLADAAQRVEVHVVGEDLFTGYDGLHREITLPPHGCWVAVCGEDGDGG